jgi:hypothetical protein
MKTEKGKGVLSRKVTRVSLEGGRIMKRLLLIAMLLAIGVTGYTPLAKAQNPEIIADTTTVSVELMAFPFEGLYPRTPVAATSTAGVELMAFPFEGLRSHGPDATASTAGVDLMAFPFEGLNPHGPVADTTTASVELMAFPFEGLNPR